MPETDLASDSSTSGANDNALIRLSREAVDVALSGDIKRGLALALEANQRARAAGDQRAELAALNAAARCHSLRNDAIHSLAAGVDAAALARKLDDGVALGHALCAIANTSFTLKLLAECEPFVQRAIAEALKHGDADLEARARQTYGVLLGDLKRFDEARAELELGVAAAKRDGRVSLLLRVEGNLINVSRKQARVLAANADTAALNVSGAKALAEAASMLERAREQKVLSLELTMTSLVGEVHALLGDIDRGIVEAMHAMELAQRNRHPSNLPPLALRAGSWLRERGRLPEAMEVLQRGLNAAETLRPTFRIAELCEAMASVEAARGAVAVADEWRLRANQERAQFETGRQMAAGFLRRLQADLA